MAENFLDLLRSKLYDLNLAEQKVANFVLAESERVQNTSISELARLASVSEATVTRFCRSLKLSGFFALKLELAKLSSDDKDVLECENADVAKYAAKEAISAIEGTVSLISEEDIIKAVSMIERAKRVLVVGFGSTAYAAAELVSVFASVSLKFLTVPDVHTQTATLSMLGRDDLVILFSYSGATNEGTELLRFASELSVPTILITHFPVSPSAEYADLTLTHSVDEHPYRAGSVPVRMAQLLLIDVLFRTYEKRNEEECRKNILHRTDALSKKHK